MPRDPRFPDIFQPDESHPMIDDFTLRAARQRARQQPTGIQPVHVIPLRNHPLWSGNNSLGIEVPIEDISAVDIFERTILKLDEWGTPEVWTIALSTNVELNSSTDDQAFSLIGLIEIGCGGAVDQFQVDWRNGTTLRLPMNALNVKIRGVAGAGVDGAGVIPPGLAARVLLSQSNQSGLSPQVTDTTIATNGAVDPSALSARIPKYAKSFRPLGLSNAAADAMFTAGNYWQFYASQGVGGALVGSINAQNAASYMGTGIPVPREARFVSFNNNAAPAALSFRLVFDLSL